MRKRWIKLHLLLTSPRTENPTEKSKRGTNEELKRGEKEQIMTSMLQFGSLFTQFPLSLKASESSPPNPNTEQPQQTETLAEFLQRLRKASGLRKEDVFCNLRVPEPVSNAKDDINIVLLTGHGIFCIDVKTWRGKVSVQNKNCLIQIKEEGQNFTNTNIEQTEDPLKTIKTKALQLLAHLKRSGVSVSERLLVPRVLFLSPDCELDPSLQDRPEFVSHQRLQDFLCSFREGYVGWISDALTPAWISGRLSYSQLGAVRGLLARIGTWDVLKLRSGQLLRGDFQDCPFIAVNRTETDTIEFSQNRTLSAESLWALLGHTPQVTVKMYKRGAQGWLGKTLSATASIPSSSCVVFRINGDETDSKIPASTVHSISLSI